MMVKELSNGRADEIRQQFEKIPYVKFLGIQLEEIDNGSAVLVLEIDEHLKRNNGIAHGGAIASLIDTATAFATLSVLQASERSTTVDLTINFLRPLTGGHARAKANIIRAGRRILTVSAEVFDDAGKLIATAISTYIKD